MTNEAASKRFKLPVSWRFCAEATARNLGFTTPLATLPGEHWQRVLIGVETKMRLKGSVLPDAWQALLAQDVGRSDE